jgi:hypothetical protein
MQKIFQKARNAAQRNLLPGLILQGFALTLVILYYTQAPVRDLLMKLPGLQQRMGLLFPALATALFGGGVPFLLMVVRNDIVRGQRLKHLLFLLSFWAINGLIVNWFYQLQGALFGEVVNAATVVKKMLVDQLVFNPVWAVPWTILVMHWKNCDFSFGRARAEFSKEAFVQGYLALLLATWTVWVPAISIVYSLPLALQFPLFNIVLCFWSLMLTALSEREKNEPTAK